MSGWRRLGFVVGTTLLSLVLAACGSGGSAPVSSGAAPSTTTRSSPAPPPSTAPPPAPTTTEPAPSTEAPATATTVPEPVPATRVAPSLPAELGRAGTAGQAVLVTARDYGSTSATLTTWQRTADGAWEQVHGPGPAYVGYAGFAPPGEKREGDGRTPSGTYGFEFAFGVEPDPGVALPYRRVTGPSIVWDDVPSSPSYNQWVDGGVGEAMFQTPAYDYAAVIAYNTARTPGLGSAIFLHVSDGTPTTGCVSLPVGRLLEVLRWLDPARAPVIVMGVA